MMSIPVATKVVVDDVIGQSRADLLVPTGLAAGLGLVTQVAVAYWTSRIGVSASQRATAHIRRKLHRHVLRLPVAYFDHTAVGVLTSRLTTDVENVSPLFGKGMLDFVSAILAGILAFAVLMWINVTLALMAMVALAVSTVALASGFGALHAAFGVVSEMQGSLAGRLTEMFTRVRVVKACAAERRESYAFVRTAHQLSRASRRAGSRAGMMAAGLTLAQSIVSFGLLILGAHLVGQGAITLGELALFLLLVGFLTTPLVQLAAGVPELGRAWAALTRIEEVLAAEMDQGRQKPYATVPRLSGGVTCDDVSYSYRSQTPVLRRVSLEIRAGATVAIVGPNGAGKSTLLALLAAFDDPTSGRILIDGHVLALVARSSYRRQLGVVLQADHLIAGTIAENIRYARPNASATDFQAAVRTARCEEFIARLPMGLNTVVGESGIRLSGGERQRLTIARALVADPRILLLDEATAHLDSESDGPLQEALAALLRSRTSFVVTHRTECLRFADRVVVLRNGLVIEDVSSPGIRPCQGDLQLVLPMPPSRSVHMRSGEVPRASGPIFGCVPPSYSEAFQTGFRPMPCVMWARTQDGLVLMDRRQQTYYALDEVGTAVWELLVAGMPLAAVVTELLARFDVAAACLTSDVKDLFERLLKAHLIVPSDSPICVDPGDKASERSRNASSPGAHIKTMCTGAARAQTLSETARF